MLRFCPLLEFRPQAATSQGTTVEHGEKAIANTQQTTDHGNDARMSSTDRVISGDTQPSFRSLLDFVREVNERTRSPVTFGAFLRQMQGERNEAEAALEQRTAAAATNFTQRLANRILEAESSARQDWHNIRAKLTTDLDADSGGPIPEPLSAQPREDTSSRSTNAQVPSLLEDCPTIPTQESLKATREEDGGIELFRRLKGKHSEATGTLCVFATTADRTESCQVVETVVCSSAAPGTVQGRKERARLSFQSVFTTAAESKPEHFILEDFGKLSLEVDIELNGLVMRDNTYGIEMLLHPFNKRDSASQTEDAVAIEREELFCKTTALRIAVHFADAATQTTADPNIQTDQEAPAVSIPRTEDVREKSEPIEYNCSLGKDSRSWLPPSKSPLPMALKVAESSISPEPTSPRTTSGGTASSPPISNTEARTSRKSQCTNLHPNNVQQLKYGVEGPLTLKKDTSQYPAKEAVTRVMAQRTRTQVNDGSDRFLSLLDLVRKK